LSLGVVPLFGERPSGFEGWPDSWVTTYERFEKFNAEREKYFPPANLEILVDGTIIHTVQFDPSRTENLGVNFFNEGFQVLGLLLTDGAKLFDENRSRIFQPGIYTAALQASGMAGFQYIYPFISFEVSLDEKGKNSLVRMLPDSEQSDDHWPSERLMKYVDFHVFPGRYPSLLLDANDRLNPSVLLTVNNSGVIERSNLDPALESLLFWRVYHNGKLVDKRPAQDMNSYAMKHGPGTYQVLVGLTGPSGFMPVSNLLHFPLFPETDGGFSILPSVTDPSGTPNFLLETSHPENSREKPETNEAIARNKRYEQLWRRWDWNVSNARNSPTKSLGSIRIKGK
jgi:hypothetical protein